MTSLEAHCRTLAILAGAAGFLLLFALAPNVVGAFLTAGGITFIYWLIYTAMRNW